MAAEGGLQGHADRCRPRRRGRFVRQRGQPEPRRGRALHDSRVPQGSARLARAEGAARRSSRLLSEGSAVDAHRGEVEPDGSGAEDFARDARASSRHVRGLRRAHAQHGSGGAHRTLRPALRIHAPECSAGLGDRAVHARGSGREDGFPRRERDSRSGARACPDLQERHAVARQRPLQESAPARAHHRGRGRAQRRDHPARKSHRLPEPTETA